MNKKSTLFLLSSLGAFSLLSGCTRKTIEIAVVTDVGSLNDGGFNQGTYEGVKQYAEANGKKYNYFMPAGQNNATDADREAAMIQAIESGAKIIVAPGYLQAKAMAKCASLHRDVKFIFMDGMILKDEKGNPLNNVTALNYREEEAGFLAGYAVTKDTKLLKDKKLGGVFGGGGSNRACNAFAYGYAQGINQAMLDLESEKAIDNSKKAELRLSYLYGDQFSASNELETHVSSWYGSGTEIVFACGGSMTFSVKSAVDKADKEKMMIGVDVDQSSLSPRIVTSAMKNLAISIKDTLALCYANQWEEKLAGKIYTLSAKENGVGLPTDTYEKDGKKIDPWRFKGFSKDEYKTLFNRIKGEAGDKNIVVESVDSSSDCNKKEFWENANKKWNKIVITLDGGNDSKK